MSSPTARSRSRAGHHRTERRAPRGQVGSLRWLKGLLGRPVALEQRDGHLHLRLVERRRSPELIRAQQRAALREELRLRLLEHGERHVAVLRPLVAVHDALGHEGWDGVGRLPSPLLAKAHLQLLMLIGREPSDALTGMAEHLRLLQAAAEVREERNLRSGVRDDDALVVVDDVVADGVSAEGVSVEGVSAEERATEDYETLQRAWVVTESPAEPGLR